MERKTIDIQKECNICGTDFTIKIRKSDGKILSKCFHSYMSKYHFLKWSYGVDWYGSKIKINKVYFKNTFWAIIGLTRLQRWIVYNLWRIFFGWQKIEYNECKECAFPSKNGNNKKNRKEN